MNATTVRVELGPRAYPVRIGPGLLQGAGAHLAPLLTRPRVAVVADRTVAALHGPTLNASLAAAGIAAHTVEVPPGETSKSFAELERVLDALLALELDRGELVVALGGGVVGDLAGFAAAVYKRGIDFVQLPTTLLAQVDSSVGGKTGIDTPRGKNLVGAFHQPRLVLADTDTLSTLPDREMRAGFAEMIKHGLLADADYFGTLEREGAAVLAREPLALTRAVARSVEIKAQVVAADEREAGRRALLNLGHTFGHALETEALHRTGDPSTVIHGEAVAVGCCQALRYSASRGFCATEEATRAERAFTAAGLPVRPADLAGGPYPVDALLAHMAQDKKAQGGRLALVLVHRIGEAFTVRDVDPGPLREFLLADGAV